MFVGLLIIMNFETGAGAAEFAALGIFLGAVIVTPVVLIAPSVVLVGAIVYQTGLWDAIT